MTAPTRTPQPRPRSRTRPGAWPYPHPTPPRRSTIAVVGALGKALAAAVTLIALLVGTPLLLVAVAGWPLPHAVPTWDQVQATLTAPGIPDQLLIDTLACLGWLCWALLALSALVEITAMLARTPTRRLPGLTPAQAVVGALIGVLAFAPILIRPHGTHFEARPQVSHSRTQSTPAPDLTGDVVLLIGDTRHTCTVHPGDTLWDLARDWLGDPNRWPEIYHLNAGHHFPDVGGTLHDPDLIYPGWTLTLPDDAQPPADAAPPPGVPSSPLSPIQTPTVTPTPTPSTTAPGPSAPAVTPSAPSVEETPSHAPSSARTNGLEVPGGWITLPLAAALTAAGATALLRRRRPYRADDADLDRPIDDHIDADDDDLQPLPAVVLAARRNVRRLAPDVLHPSADGVAVQPTARPHHDRAAPGRPAIPPNAAAVDDLLQATTEAIHLTGPGALDAARALLVAALTAGAPGDPDAQSRVIMPDATRAEVLPNSEPALPADAIPRLTISDDLDAALTEIEGELIARRRLLLAADADNREDYLRLPDHEPLPRLVFITQLQDDDRRARVEATARLGTALAIGVIVLGDATIGTELDVQPDGRIKPTTGTGARRTGRPERVAVLDTHATLDVLRMLATTLGSATRSAPGPVTSQPAVELSAEPATVTATSPAAPGTSEALQSASGISPTAPDRVRVTVLGTPAILDADGNPVDSVREAALELLTYLAIHRKGAPLDEIKEALYGDATRERAKQRLSTDVANLRGRIRHALGDTASGVDPVLNTKGHYRLNPDLVDVDFWRVQDAAARAKATTTPAERLPALREALDHYHGVLAADREYDWIDHPRTHTRQLGLALYLTLAAADPDHAAQHLDAACNLDPYNEDAAQQAIRAHTQNGNTDAVRHRLRCLRIALAEIDETPSADTEALAHELLDRPIRSSRTPVASRRADRPDASP
jgi:DNA-binding SARP family transcriptional activator